MGNTLGDCRKNRTNRTNRTNHHTTLKTATHEHDEDCCCCVICLEPTIKTATTTTTTTTCQHTFHTACLAAWGRLKDTCPLCRHRLAAPSPSPYVIGRKYHIEYRYRYASSCQVYYNGTLSEIIQPNAHGNTCYRFTFPTPSLKYYFFDNIYNFVAVD
jgi:hypothetical protein